MEAEKEKEINKSSLGLLDIFRFLKYLSHLLLSSDNKDWKFFVDESPKLISMDPPRP